VLAPETLVTAGPLWTVAVNRNQNLLGKTVLVVNRPVESVTALRPDEWADLHRQIARVTVALDELFEPDQSFREPHVRDSSSGTSPSAVGLRRGAGVAPGPFPQAAVPNPPCGSPRNGLSACLAHC
jgi:hypothetical protein